MNPTVSYKQHDLSGDWDAIIVGSGIGGLATAALLSKNGQRVLVLERHYVGGGYTHVFTRKGYEWDVGVHYIGEVHRETSLIRRLFDYITDGQLKWAEMGDVYDRIRFGEEEFAFKRGQDHFKTMLKERFTAPKDQAAIDQYLELVHEVVRSARGFFMEKAMPPLVGAIAGTFMRRKLMKHAKRTTFEVLSELTDNPKLIAVLTGQWGDYGLPPKQSSFAMHCMLVRHYLGGGSYPIGGSAAMLETIAPIIQKAGGLIVTNAEVTRVNVSNNKATGVTMSDGKVIDAPVVVSGTGYINTVTKLLDPKVVQKHKLNAKLAKVRPSASHVCLYIGFKDTSEALELPQSNYWLYPNNYDHDAVVEHFLDNPKNEFPVVYISFPSAKDPDWNRRFPNRSTVEIITIAPYEWFERWKDTRWKKRGPEYEQFKEEFSQRLLKRLYEVEPQLEGKVDYYELSTPLSTEHFCNYSKGEIYGLDHTPSRFEQRFLRPHTPIKQFYLTGQDIATAGVGGALSAGMMTASAILNKNVLSDVLTASN